MDLATQVYALTNDFPKSEVYGLTSQMRRAAVSVPSNVAESSVRGTRKDFKQFVAIARGSNCELQTQILLAKRLGFGDEKQLLQSEELSHDVGQMLTGLSKYLASAKKVAAANEGSAGTSLNA
jgi:four helix bundle protein